ncbi:MAG TPA: hypothetical protein VM822_01075, partial [Pseudolabrys sp.]|nr:hypothetical protein [Pseudolabrys sp.]
RQETIIGNGMDRTTQPSWPRVSADNTADVSTLPVPDPSPFEPDTLPSEDTADVQWPVEPDLKTPTPTRHARSEKSARHVARGMARGGATRHDVAHNAATHQSMYMYVPAQGHSPHTQKKGALKTGTH